MLDQKNETNKEVSSTPISDEFAEYIFKNALVNLKLNADCVSQNFRKSLIQSIVNESLKIKQSDKFRTIITADDYYKKSLEKMSKKVIITPEIEDKVINGSSNEFAVMFCMNHVLNNNQSVYKKMYINDLREQFDKFDDPKNLDKFFKIYQLLKREISSPDSSYKKRESDLTDKYYKKLIRLCNGDKKKFIDFCETTEGKILSGFEKTMCAIAAIVFGYGWDWYQRVVHPSDTRGYEPYLKDKYWNENVLSQDNKNEFTGDTNKITQDYRKSKAREKTTIQTKSEQRPLSNMLSKSLSKSHNNMMIEMDELNQNGKKLDGKKLESKGESK